MFCLKQIQAIKESNIYSPEIAKAGSQNLQWLPWAEELVLIELEVTVMEVDESDEYLKTVCAPQSLKFFNISNQIHSMYQLFNTVYIRSGVDNIRKNVAAFSGT